ncbi:IclR family transcriptional regulator [Caballeronia sp. LZ032]|uniref:IclR family transcriptional regulator n=1 Tax=Caballeronia sp. LZ032 TaxID=3038565 RepID=UPI0028679356|nr:IclR family transcriptional regulator [Caballeronia sp. LZ032]MDR5878681.1 IclR family transcriptional regulator [Caballeronia sp. LZ032]
MQPGRSLPTHVDARSDNGPHGLDTAWPKMPRGERAPGGAMVTPLVRGLSILAEFTPDKPWLGNLEIAQATGIPAPTVLRLLKSLLALGYLHQDKASRKYSLAAASLALGYAAIADPDLLRLAGIEMQKLAQATDTYVLLGTRDRLDILILDTRIGSRAVLDLRLRPGMRMHIAYSLMGWALLAALPDSERAYLLGELERRPDDNWPTIGRRTHEKIAQVRELGFGMLHGEWEPELACVAAPVPLPDRPPLVLGCVGRTARLAQARLERELGPRLVAIAETLRGRVPVPV